uniref:Uncharacterized protein n=1 Tax=Rhipicephalus zambeziensis TaxID=60191 RepID=A0A224YBJ5_9ACAR
MPKTNTRGVNQHVCQNKCYIVRHGLRKLQNCVTFCWLQIGRIHLRRCTPLRARLVAITRIINVMWLACLIKYCLTTRHCSIIIRQCTPNIKFTLLRIGHIECKNKTLLCVIPIGQVVKACHTIGYRIPRKPASAPLGYQPVSGTFCSGSTKCICSMYSLS